MQSGLDAAAISRTNKVARVLTGANTLNRMHGTFTNVAFFQ